MEEDSDWKKNCYSSAYSPQLVKSQYGGSWQDNKRASANVEGYISRYRDIKKVTASRHITPFSTEPVSKLSQFKLTKQLGEGKFGTVFAALHTPTNILFALKRIPKEIIRNHMMVPQLTT